jgi:hypothetical protein
MVNKQVEYDEKTENIKQAEARLKAIKTRIKSNDRQLPVKMNKTNSI